MKTSSTPTGIKMGFGGAAAQLQKSGSGCRIWDMSYSLNSFYIGDYIGKY